MFFFFYLWNLIFWVAGWFGMWKVSLDKSDIFFLQWTVRVVGEAFKLLSKKCPHLCYRKCYRLTQPIQKLLFAIMFSFVIAWNQAYIDYTSHIFFSDEIFFFPLAQVNLCIYLHCNYHYHNRWVLTGNRKHMFL